MMHLAFLVLTTIQGAQGKRFRPGQTVYVAEKSRPARDRAFEYRHLKGEIVCKQIEYGGKQDRWTVRFDHGEKRFPETELLWRDQVEISSVNEILNLVADHKWATVIFNVQGKSSINGDCVEHKQKAYICKNAAGEDLKLAWITRTKGCQVLLEDLTEADWKKIKVARRNSTYVKKMITLIRENPDTECMLCKVEFPGLGYDGHTPIQLSCKCAWFCSNCLRGTFQNEKARWRKWYVIKCPYRDVIHKAGIGAVTKNCPTYSLKELDIEDLEKWAEFAPDMMEWKEQRDIDVKSEMKKMDKKWHCRNPEEKWNPEQGDGKLCKQCPSCERFIMKIPETCDHMTCDPEEGGCGFQFCWLCGKRYVRNDKVGNIKLKKGYCSTHCKRTAFGGAALSILAQIRLRRNIN